VTIRSSSSEVGCALAISSRCVPQDATVGGDADDVDTYLALAPEEWRAVLDEMHVTAMSPT
jgi:hypothetical protein